MGPGPHFCRAPPIQVQFRRFGVKQQFIVAVRAEDFGMHTLAVSKTDVDVTVSVSSLRSIAATSKTPKSVQSKQDCDPSFDSVHLFTVLTTGSADFKI